MKHRSAKAARRGPKHFRNSSPAAASGASVLREFLRRFVNARSILKAGAVCLTLIPLSALFTPMAVAQTQKTAPPTPTTSPTGGTASIKGIGSAGYVPKFLDQYT